MSKKILVFGSIVATVILIFSSSPSVVSTQSMDEERFNRLEETITDRIQRDNRFEDMDIGTIVSALQNIKKSTIFTNWEPGMIIGIILYIILTIIFNMLPLPPF